MRLAYYAGASTAAAAACLLKAFHERPNLYSATVYLSQSNACLLILTNILLVCACSFLYILQRLLYGPLRPIEIEQLSEKAWYAVLDTLLAMPSFREDVGGWLLTMFVLLLAGKVWGWIGEGRVDVLEQQPPANPRLFHARLATSLIVSVAFDLWMTHFCFETVAADPRPGMMVIFTFEFAIQSVFSTFTLMRYTLSVISAIVTDQQMAKAIDERKDEIRAERAAERQNETADGRPAPASPPPEEPIEVDENEVDVPGWEEKRRWLFGLEVMSDFLKLVLYIVFFAVSVTFNGLPMHIMRDVYMTFASFTKRVNDYANYKKATSDMNARYPDATTEEIRGDACIVCRENMLAWEQAPAAEGAPPAGEPAPPPRVRRDEGLRAKKLPCGHILHLRCLKAWLERQQVCPTCRRPVITAPAVNANDQPGHPEGANPAAAGQHNEQQHRARPPNRARFFNLGPIRIGLLNGPAGQMDNIMNQLRNGQAAPRARPEAQEGPNHLGLQAPYQPQPIGAQAAAPATGQGPRSSLPTQIQLMQIEQSLVQQASSLRVELTQLNTLRIMERELARLRALHTQAQAAVDPIAAAQQQATAHVSMPAAGPNIPVPTPTGFLSQPTFNAPHPEVLHGNQAQQMGQAHGQLPPGLTLPEGWTVMPLHRQAAGVFNPAATPTPPGVPTVAQQPNAAPLVQAPDAPGAPGPDAAPATAASNGEGGQPQTATPLGPTDDRGSPLFVPTAPNDGVPASSIEPVDAPPAASDLAQTAEQGGANAPWASGGWGFGGSAAGANADQRAGQTAERPSTVNAGPDSSEPDRRDKGKGRTVEVEDAPDAGS